MRFNLHSDLTGSHAFLAASRYHWVNYTDEKLLSSYKNYRAKFLGDELHEFAQKAINLGIKLPKSASAINRYVNDAIGYRMIPEQVLYYSKYAYGTADAIVFDRGLLRIHDLKTGAVPASMRQLDIYAAFFCLEYQVDPDSIRMDLRIYQGTDVVSERPEDGHISNLMAKIVHFDKLIHNEEASL